MRCDATVDLSKCYYDFYTGRPGTGHSSRGSGQLTVNDVDEEELGTPSNASSRARILAQQREIQLKRRQSSVNGGGKFFFSHCC